METITYLVQKNTAGKVKFIQFTLDGDTLTREYGIIGGVIQGTTNTYKTINAGKSNELGPIAVAFAEYNRIWKTKQKEGYVPAQDLTHLPDLPDYLDKIDLDDIPTEFCCSKPTAKISDTVLAKLLASGNARLFVKYNGGCHYVVIRSTGEVKIFTRRWDDHTIKYPKHVKAFEDEKYPPNTLLIIELAIDPLLNLPHMTAQKYAAKISKTETNNGICKADQSQSIALQEKYPLKSAIFGFLYYNGAKLWDQPYSIILKLIEKKVPKLSDNKLLFQPQSVGLDTVKKIYDTAKAHKKLIEGFIVWDITKAMEVTMNGKPARRAAWKVKIKDETDVIAYGWVNAKNKPAGIIGALEIGQYDAQGVMVPLGTAGGLKPTEGECDPKNWAFPCVIEVGFDNRFPETGMFQFPHFNKLHESKTIEEVDIFDLEKL